MKTTTSGRHPTTAEWLAGRDGVICVDHVRNNTSVQQWTRDGKRLETWAYIAGQLSMDAEALSADHLLVKVNDDAQTIRVLVDGDDALVVVHVHDCGYHKSMKRGMRVTLRGLKAARKAAHVWPNTKEHVS